MRVDFIDETEYIVIELKPQGYEKEGWKQINKYLTSLREFEKGGVKHNWRGVVLEYNSNTALRLLAQSVREENPKMTLTESAINAYLIGKEYKLLYEILFALRLLAQYLREENPKMTLKESVIKADLIAKQYNL